MNQFDIKGWFDIKLYQYQELKQLDTEYNGSTFEYIIEQLSIIMDTDSTDDVFYDMDIDNLLDLIKEYKWLRHNPGKRVIDDMSVRELKRLTVGEFLDLEYYFEDDYYKNLHLIAAILYKKSKIDEWDNVIIEPYIYDVSKRGERYLDISIEYTFWLVEYYLSWKESIMESYKYLFEENDSDEIEDEHLLDQEEIADIKRQIADDNIKKKWGWQAIIFDLCNNDLSKYIGDKSIFDVPIILFLNTLSMKKDLNI